MEGSSSRSDWLAGLAAAAVVGLFGLMLAGFFVPAYDGTDENGYLCAARRLALTGAATKHTTHPLEFVSGNVVQTGDSVFYPKYPLGYPWLAALAYRLGGESAAFWVNPLLATLAVAGIFLLARAMVGALAGVLAALVLATNSLHAGFGLSALSHSGAICFAIWGMFYLWRWTQSGGWWNAFAAGGFTAYTYTIRYSEALLVVPVVAMVLWRYFNRAEGATPTARLLAGRRWRWEVGGMALGAALLLAPLWAYHWSAFGAPWRNGYDLCGESTGFAWKWFQENWWLMLTRLNAPGLLLIFPLGLAGLAYLTAHDRKRALLLGLWLVPTLLLYSAYYWAPQGEGRSYVRFFVSVFPPLIVCALALLCEAVKPRPGWSLALGGFFAVVTTYNLRSTLTDLEVQMQRLQHIRRSWDMVQRHMPAGSILLAARGGLNHLEFAGDYELYALETFDRNAIQSSLKILNHNDPHPLQRRKAQELARTVGALTDGQLANLQRSLLASNVASGRRVAVVCPPDQLRSVRGRLGEAFIYEPMTEWLQTSFGKTGEVRVSAMRLYQLQARPPGMPSGESLAALEEKADQLEFQMKVLRADFATAYPGAQKSLDEIRNSEQQLRELREKIKRQAGRKPPAPATNLAGRAELRTTR
ncbi:MAG: hypothetical protein PCFJNLEI_00199 [Verrucomicrobiae bacterium]|nr:hypothetical protein [Verrucomicrobiae bacterium]